MSNLIFIAVCLLGLFLVTIHSNQEHEIRFATLVLGTQPIKVEVVTTDQEMYQGLSGRTKLCSNCGMLFTFSKASRQTFVMRQMNFPLDIIWLNHGKFIGVNANLTPEKEPYTLYQSPAPVDQVLEVNAGFYETIK